MQSELSKSAELNAQQQTQAAKKNYVPTDNELGIMYVASNGDWDRLTPCQQGDWCRGITSSVNPDSSKNNKSTAAIVRTPNGKTSVMFRADSDDGSSADLDDAQLREARQVWGQLGPVLAQIAAPEGRRALFQTPIASADPDDDDSGSGDGDGHVYSRYLQHAVAPKHAFGL
jgi:hypothetical protein